LSNWVISAYNLIICSCREISKIP